MRILHTSDWHVGRTVRGRSRADEHRAVLDEIAGIAHEREVDLILVAGDQFDTGAPSAESEAIVYRALLDLAATGAHVVVLAGNHDNPRRWAAIRPLLELGNVAPRRPGDAPGPGGRARPADPVAARSPGSRWCRSCRSASIVTGEQFMANDAAQQSIAPTPTGHGASSRR